jgi:hypothetical protein
MSRRWFKPLGILFLAGTLFTCIEPFNPGLNDYKSLLVVDALLTDENTSNYVRLSRTKETLKELPEKVTGATVLISDDAGKSTLLQETSEGLYKTDSLTFRGLPGKSYTLHIKTADGKEYESEPCTLYEGREIDSLYFGKDRETLEDGEVLGGVRVYIDSKEPTDSRYFRWTYEEWWKFKIPVPKSFEYVNQNNIYEIPLANVTCWKNKRSDEILIQSSGTGVNGPFVKKPVLFIPAEKSDRLLVQYCIEVRQYSISKSEYEFWDHMMQINDAGGDIFDKQPFQIISNIHSISNSEERVVGYFQVSAVRRAKQYLTRKEVDMLDLELYSYDCDLLILGPGDPETLVIEPPITFNKINEYFTSLLNYIFVMPSYNDIGALEKLIFVRNICANCSLTGSLDKPDFWIDL